MWEKEKYGGAKEERVRMGGERSRWGYGGK